jgi:hypothetical protein
MDIVTRGGSPMRKLSTIVTIVAIAGLAISSMSWTNAQAQENPSPLTVGSGDARIHVLPTVGGAHALAPSAFADTGPLLYNGGPIMPHVTTYAIFWIPPRLQTGASTGVSANYRPLVKRFLNDYPGHGIDNNNTQYYQSAATTTFIRNAGHFGGAITDTSPYPTSLCSDPATPGACLTDGQIRSEVKKIVTLKGWPVGLTSMFLVFTANGEGSCTSASSSVCAYTYYCAYHGHIGTGASAIIYGNQPYADPSVCQIPGAPSPNNDPAADDEISIASHEMTEAITDPMLNAWYTAQFNEIGDLCAYNYGSSLGWDGGNANEMWNGNFYLVQQEFDNFAGGCVQVGP